MHKNSISFAPQKLNAIIGVSGCGKSTLVDMMRGKIPNADLTGKSSVELETGENIVLDYSDLSFSNLRKVRQIFGYIPQDDVISGDLTVRENILYAAQLKLPFVEKEMIRDIVESTLKLLGFDEKVQNTIVGTVETRGVSGGQRKRVNIGTELVGMNSVLFLDEPTSGLDSSGAKDFLEACKLITGMGVTLIAIVHQPRFDSFMLFDDVLILGKNGTIFFGQPGILLLYFYRALDFQLNPDENPCDAIMDIVVASDQNKLVKIWNNTGIEWVKQCQIMYPCVHEMLTKTFIYEKTEMMTREPENSKEVYDFFKYCSIPITLKDAEEIYKKNNFKKTFEHVCSTEMIENKFSNVVYKLNLFDQVPKSIEQQKVHCDMFRTTTLAIMFIIKLRKRIGLASLSSRKNENNCDKFFLMACLALKAFDDKGKMQLLQSVKGNPRFKNLTRPNMLQQIWVLIKRRIIVINRSFWFLQIVIVMLAAFIVALINGSDWSISSYPTNISMFMVVIGVLSGITHMKTFSQEKLLIIRETSEKIRTLSYFISYNLTDMFWIFTFPLVYSVIYFFISYPLTNFGYYFVTVLMTCWWTSGLAYALSTLPININWANLICVFIIIIFGAFLQGLNPTINQSRGTIIEVLLSLSYNRWATEALVIKEFEIYNNDYNIILGTFNKIGFCGFNENITNMNSTFFFDQIQNYKSVSARCHPYVTWDFIYLLIMGIVMRVFAYFALRISIVTGQLTLINMKLKKLYNFKRPRNAQHIKNPLVEVMVIN